MRSMTGFGQAEEEVDGVRISVVLRGVNHRFLDVSLRGCDEHREVEPALRELLAGRLWRGRVEVGVEVTATGTRPVKVGVDEALVRALREVCDTLAERGLISPRLELRDLLRLPDVVRVETRGGWGEAEQQRLLAVAGAALEQLVAARATEGEKLYRALAERLDALVAVTAQMRERRAAIAGELAQSLRQRVAELIAGTPLDPDRMAQEVALLAERSDVAEELDRLRSHVEHFRAIMAEEGSIGKRLDFLAQEIFRELNTIGAKCRDSAMTRQMLDGKVLCEQLREQVQNVE